MLICVLLLESQYVRYFLSIEPWRKHWKVQKYGEAVEEKNISFLFRIYHCLCHLLAINQLIKRRFLFLECWILIVYLCNETKKLKSRVDQTLAYILSIIIIISSSICANHFFLFCDFSVFPLRFSFFLLPSSSAVYDYTQSPVSIVGVEAAERLAPRIIIAIARTMQVLRGRKGWRVAASVSLPDDIICHYLLVIGRFYFLRFWRFRVIWRRLSWFHEQRYLRMKLTLLLRKISFTDLIQWRSVIFVTSVECLFHSDKVERNSFLSIRDKKVHLIFYIATVFCSSARH